MLSGRATGWAAAMESKADTMTAIIVAERILIVWKWDSCLDWLEEFVV